MATETIKVTESDIREACFRRDAGDYDADCECPIAQAVRQRHPEWRVRQQWIVVNKVWEIRLPPEATRFIKRFDANMAVEPFEFEIEV